MTKKKANYGKVSTAENPTPDEAPPSMAVVAGYRRRNAMTFEVQESATNSRRALVVLFVGGRRAGVVVVGRSSSSDAWRVRSFELEEKGPRGLAESDPIFLGAVQAANDYLADLERLGPELMRKRPGYS